MNFYDLQRKYIEYYRELGYSVSFPTAASFNASVLEEADYRFTQTGVFDLPMLTTDEVQFVIHNTPQ